MARSVYFRTNLVGTLIALGIGTSGTGSFPTMNSERPRTSGSADHERPQLRRCCGTVARSCAFTRRGL